MDRQRKNPNITSRSKRRSEPTRLTSGMRLELRSSRPASSSTIWDTLEEAKKKQETIRKRVRTYGREDDDSDYNDSPSYDEPSRDTPSCDCNTNLQVHEEVNSNSESDSDECDDEVTLEPPLNERENEAKIRVLPQSLSNPSPGSNFSASRSECVQNRTLQVNTKTSVSNRCSSQNEIQQSQTRIKYLARKNSSSNRRGEKQPVLTPKDAIRLVMERHSYISDSERTEDDHPLPTRKFSKGSSSTNETAINTVHSDSGHNRTSERKRMLVLRKKFREDTHPHTSRKKLSKRSSNEGTHIQPLQQTKDEQFHQSKKQQQQQQQPEDSTQRSAIDKKNDKIQAKVNTSRRTTKPDLPPSLKLLSRLHEQGIVQEIEENKSHSNSQRKQGGGELAESNVSALRDQNDVDEEANDNNLNHSKETYSENQHHSMKRRYDYAVTANEKLLQHPHPPAENEAILEKEIVLTDDNDDSHLSDSDSDTYDDNILSTDDGYMQLTLNPSKKLECVNVAIDETREIIFPEQSDTRDNYVGDDEDDWRAASWKTAKTSRSAASKFSKSSSTSIWMKGVGEGDSENLDNTLFFDAIQDAGQMNIQTSMEDAPSTIIINQVHGKSTSHGQIDAAVPKEQEGWTGKITSFVGYTIGALSGSKNEYDKNNSGADDTSGKDAYLSAIRTPRSSMNKSKSPNSPSKPVPSRELEIIRKCQALMKSQRSLLEIREKESERNLLEDIRLRRKEEAARARVWREVMAYREMMEGMGKSDKLAPLDSKDAAQEYDDRLSMIKTLQDQENKMKMHEQEMKQMEMGINDEIGKDPQSCSCSCTIS
mmetsp:Transcript_8968/g.21895  ORF Transcript_8968/g.21895 Transcript_8968/m.21895 type:complete len:821 (+) Transcript_8968:147-2609(+)|eukprot:CAMPEP_0197184050 /NCGR_PEP_ID=MMETSP1423-20130617/9111_1 /TAXON_ID=476441 /ORGANISM="Pseudo-nitzschia heimii, Strain UNC1101" /LENGTH=820 /DNA_ID=CAMNT_0042634769 /DNA_START=57 /DNA_END=2519 /DNA_ORIENTATION=+